MDFWPPNLSGYEATIPAFWLGGQGSNPGYTWYFSNVFFLHFFLSKLNNMDLPLPKNLLARDLSPFFDFEDTSSQIKLLIFICGERSCNANFKMGSAVSVGSQKVEKYYVYGKFSKIKFWRRPGLNPGPYASKPTALPLSYWLTLEKKFPTWMSFVLWGWWGPPLAQNKLGNTWH